jgi:hypothetical protein
MRARPRASRTRLLRTTYEHVVGPGADDRNRRTKRARIAPQRGLLLVVLRGRVGAVEPDASFVVRSGCWLPLAVGYLPASRGSTRVNSGAAAPRAESHSRVAANLGPLLGWADRLAVRWGVRELLKRRGDACWKRAGGAAGEYLGDEDRRLGQLTVLARGGQRADGTAGAARVRAAALLAHAARCAIGRLSCVLREHVEGAPVWPRSDSLMR